MRMRISFLCALLTLFLLSACSSFGGSGSASGAPASDASGAPVASTYVGEFTDIPIPREMQEVGKYTAIVLNQDGTKAGTQVFEGNVELQSLMNAMLYNMSKQGWTPRGVFRGQRSALVFEKGNSLALVTATEGTFNTEMELWVAKKISDGAIHPRENPSMLPPVIEGNPL